MYQWGKTSRAIWKLEKLFYWLYLKFAGFRVLSRCRDCRIEDNKRRRAEIDAIWDHLKTS